MLNSVSPFTSSPEPARPWRPPVPDPFGASTAPGMDATAAHFLQQAPSLRSVADLANDPTSRSFLQHALGVKLNPEASAQAQAELISAMLDFHEFQIPSRLQQFITLYNARSQAHELTSGTDPASPMHLGRASVSAATLEHLARLRIGGGR